MTFSIMSIDHIDQCLDVDLVGFVHGLRHACQLLVAVVARCGIANSKPSGVEVTTGANGSPAAPRATSL